MKEIKVSDEHYDLLMEFSKELRQQENDGQGFPYFWNPASTERIESNEDGETMIYSGGHGNSFTLEEYKNEEPECWKSFCEYWEIEDDSFNGYESEWADHIKDTEEDCHIYYEEDYRKHEHNFSIFKSDVKTFIKCNSHHLGENPSTYARTIWRMPKMVKLMKILYSLNQTEELNEEAAHSVKDSK